MSKKGRPPTDTEQLTLRLPRDLLDAVDTFRRQESDLPTRPEAIRRLLRKALNAGPSSYTLDNV